MKKYLLPCECGQSVPVEATQAGQRVACACGRTLAVPALRAIRQLPQEEVAVAERPAKRAWTPGHGTAFALGVLLVLVGLFLVVFAHVNQRNIRAQLADPADIAAWVDLIDSFTLEDLWAYWIEIRKEALPASLTTYANAMNLLASLRRVTAIGAGLIVVGCCAIGAAWLLARSRPAKRPASS